MADSVVRTFFSASACSANSWWLEAKRHGNVIRYQLVPLFAGTFAGRWEWKWEVNDWDNEIVGGFREVVLAVETLAEQKISDSDKEVRVEKIKNASITFSEKLLPPDLKKILAELLSAPQTQVALSPDSDCQAIGWELVYLGSGAEGFYVGEAEGLFQRIPVNESTWNDGLIDGAELIIGTGEDNGDQNRKIINKRLEDIGICMDSITTIKTVDQCRDVFGSREFIVFIGSNSDEGLCLNPSFKLDKTWVGNIELKQDAILAMATCRPHGANDDILHSHSLATSIYSKWGCNTIFCLTKIPVEVAASVGARVYDNFLQKKFSSLAKAWRDAFSEVESPYRACFALNGNWNRSLNQEVKSVSDH